MLSRMLGYALEHGLWDEAYAILEPLALYWLARGQTGEFDSWFDRVRLATEDESGQPPDPASGAGHLWMAAVGGQVLRHKEENRLDRAAQAALRLVAVLEALPAAQATDSRLGNTYLQL